MKNIFATLNLLETEGIIEKYALGGANALLFYAEPISTYDLDVFVFLKEEERKIFVNLNSIYKFLQSKGWSIKNEYLEFNGVPVQILPAPTKLVEEAVSKALKKDFEGVPVKVISLEYLVAIMLETNRTKDRERIGMLLEEDLKIDNNKLSKILKQYNLGKKWETIIGKFKKTD